MPQQRLRSAPPLTWGGGWAGGACRSCLHRLASRRHLRLALRLHCLLVERAPLGEAIRDWVEEHPLQEPYQRAAGAPALGAE